MLTSISAPESINSQVDQKKIFVTRQASNRMYQVNEKEVLLTDFDSRELVVIIKQFYCIYTQ